jgi:hypothetical protein
VGGQTRCRAGRCQERRTRRRRLSGRVDQRGLQPRRQPGRHGRGQLGHRRGRRRRQPHQGRRLRDGHRVRPGSSAALPRPERSLRGSGATSRPFRSGVHPRSITFFGFERSRIRRAAMPNHRDSRTRRDLGI